MKTIIAGSRSIRDQEIVNQAISDSGFVITEVVYGGALGVDTLGFNWAWTNGIPVKTFLPDWKRYRRSAGIFRNRQMGDYADALIAVWDGQSKGTAQMVAYAQEKGLKVFLSNLKSGG